MSKDQNTLPIGSSFGQHRILRMIGSGGMGQVYEAEHELTGETHALKLLSQEVMEVPGALARFEREAKVMARLDHPGIVLVDFAGENEGKHWLRMELIPGREVDGNLFVTLEDYVSAKGGRLPESEVKSLVNEILDALGHAHEKGLVHRDLKPANILLDGPRIKISDFGLVNTAGAEWMESKARGTVLDQDQEETILDISESDGRSRSIMGTYAYMSPEQRKGEPSDSRSDLYAVGLMAFRMLTGEETPGMQRTSELGLGLDSGWDDWLIRALKGQASERYSTAAEMIAALPLSPVAKPAPVVEPTPVV
ncbi:MAG: serine/threonine protein kinase, partial [Opitutae bacterium]|nr:serine/threonine protein kinase [Opitutae bacterium]